MISLASCEFHHAERFEGFLQFLQDAFQRRIVDRIIVHGYDFIAWWDSSGNQDAGEVAREVFCRRGRR